MSKKQHYISLRFPIGEMEEEERIQVRGMLKSFVTALYKDIIGFPKTNMLFFLRERLKDRKSSKLLVYALYYFVKNHDNISLESVEHEPLNPTNSTTSKLLKVSERLM